MAAGCFFGHVGRPRPAAIKISFSVAMQQKIACGFFFGPAARPLAAAIMISFYCKSDKKRAGPLPPPAESRALRLGPRNEARRRAPAPGIDREEL